MKGSLGLRIIAWIMLVMGIIFFLISMVGVKAALQDPVGRRALLPVLVFGIANAVLGIGLLKLQKWAVYGAIGFGGIMVLWYLRMGGLFLGGPFYSAGLIFYAVVLYFSISYAIWSRSAK